jgi:hypothetical protein
MIRHSAAEHPTLLTPDSPVGVRRSHTVWRPWEGSGAQARRLFLIDQPWAATGMESNYKKLGLGIPINTLVFLLTYVLIDRWDHFYPNTNRM